MNRQQAQDKLKDVEAAVNEPPIIKDPESHTGKACHVKGWNLAAVFNLVSTDGVTHELITPRTGKRYATKNDLIYTRKNNPNNEIIGFEHAR